MEQEINAKPFEKVYNDTELFAVDVIVNKVSEHCECILDKLTSSTLNNSEENKEDMNVVRSDIIQYCNQWLEFTRKFKVTYNRMRKAYAKGLNSNKEEYDKKVKEIKEEYDKKVKDITEEYDKKFKEIKEEYNKSLEEKDGQIINGVSAFTAFKAEADKYCEKFEEAVERYKILNDHCIELENYIKNELKESRTNTKELLNLINTKADLIANAEGARRRKEKHPMRGKDHINYNHSIDDSELIDDYKKSGDKVTKEMLDKYDGMTYQGLKNRLVKAGVWVGRH